MGLLNPWFLAGVAAIGLPVWLHLLRKYRQIPQPFSSLMFFEQRVQSSVRHRRLRYLVLLAIRCALLALLSLAFANPFVKRTSVTAPRKTMAVIVVDRSFSMQYGTDLEQAKSEARRILAGLPGRTLAQVLAADSQVEALTQPELDKGTLTAAVDTIRASDEASSFGELSRALRAMDQRSGMRLDVHFISDMQQSSMPADFHDLQVGPNTSLHLHEVGEKTRPNWAVENVTGTSHVYDPSHARLSATVSGWNTEPVRGAVTLYMDGKPTDSKTVRIPANGRTQVDFQGFDVPYGFHRAEVRIDASDKLTADNAFPFAMDRTDPRKVLFLYDGDRAQQAFYYRAALESTPDSGLTVQAAPLETAADIDLSKFAYVVLNDPGNLDSRTAQELCTYVSRGAAILIALGHETEGSGRVPLSSDRISGQHEPERAATFNTAYPALEGVAQFENVSFSENGTLRPKANARVLAELEDGSPLIVEESMGEGKTLLLNSSLDLSTSDFPLHSSWVPFVIQTGHYLAGFEQSAQSVAAGTSVTLRQTNDQSTAADVIGPEGRHELSLGDASKAKAFTVFRSGFYEVQRADRKRLLVAVHSDRRESDLTRVPEETLELWRNTGSAGSGSKNGQAQTQSVDASLGRYVLLLALLLAISESIFGRRYLRASLAKES